MNPPLSSRCRWLSSIVRTSPAVGRKSCQRARRLARTGQRLRARQHTPAALADALRQELAPWRVKVVVIEPASINSSAAGNVTRDAAMAAALRGRILYDDAFGKMLAAVMQRREDADSPPDVAAATITRALTAARPRNVYLTGKYSRPLALLSLLPSPCSTPHAGASSDCPLPDPSPHNGPGWFKIRTPPTLPGTPKTG
jgi:hypothetical protein